MSDFVAILQCKIFMRTHLAVLGLLRVDRQITDTVMLTVSKRSFKSHVYA